VDRAESEMAPPSTADELHDYERTADRWIRE